MKLSLFISIFFYTMIASGQSVIKVEASADTVIIGELVEITYTIENGEGEFEAPDFSKMPVVSGPNTSTSFMIQNGKKSSSQSYSYILRPMEEQVLEIPAGVYTENDERQIIDPLRIVVLAKEKIQPSSSPLSVKVNATSKANREKRKF